MSNGSGVAPYLNQRADNGADHVAQKTVGADLEIPVRGVCLHPPGVSYGTNVGFVIGMQFCKRCKIVSTEQTAGGEVHGIEVKRTCAEPGQRVPERVGFGVDKVTVSAFRRVKTGVGIIGNRYQMPDHYVRTANGVERAYQSAPDIVCQRHVRVKVRRHAASIYTGVGASGAGHCHGMPQQSAKRLLHHLLYGDVARLDLPPVIRSASKSYVQKVAHSVLFEISVTVQAGAVGAQERAALLRGYPAGLH